MEDEKNSEKSPKPIFSKTIFKHSSTYTAGKVVGVGGKIKRKRVVFVDRAQNGPLCTVYNYEQVEILDEEVSPKSTSCTCVLF